MNNDKKAEDGAGGGSLPLSQECCKLPQRGLRQSQRITACTKHCIKMRAKKKIVCFLMNNNLAIHNYKKNY